MKELNYNRHSWHAWLYENTYGYGLPTNICAYFWKLLAAMALFIPNIPAIILNTTLFKNDKESLWWTWIIHPIVLGFGILRYDKNTLHHASFWFLYCWGWFMILLLLLSAGIFFGGIWLYYTIVDLFKKRQKQPTVSKPSPIVEGWKAFKGKYCSRINWQ